MLRKTVSISILSLILILILYIFNSISIQHSLANKVLRLHILANSNSSFDQNLKLKVRDKVVEFLTPKLENSTDLNETKKIISGNMDNIKNIASEVVSEYADYPIAVSLNTSNFPTKHYQKVSFPAGEYEALKIIIGEGKGNNWWCVMFPPLCFTDSSAGTFNEKSEKTLKENLTDEEYNLINSDKPDVKIKFRLLEWWNS